MGLEQLIGHRASLVEDASRAFEVARDLERTTALEQTARAVTGVDAEDGGSLEELGGGRVPGTAARLPRG